MKKMYLLIVLILAASTFAACGNKKPNELHYTVEDFQYKDQSDKPFSLENLKHKVWIANFFFTRCTTVCPMLTANMAQLQKDLKAAGVEIEIVSFSVDPEHHKPSDIKKYISKFKGDFTNWHALTGYDFTEIQKFARQSFKSAIEQDTTSDQVIHGTSFFLADKTGTIVARYDGLDSPNDQIIKAVKALNRD